MLVHADTWSNAACTALCVEMYTEQQLIILWASDYDMTLHKECVVTMKLLFFFLTKIK